MVKRPFSVGEIISDQLWGGQSRTVLLVCVRTANPYIYVRICAYSLKSCWSVKLNLLRAELTSILQLLVSLARGYQLRYTLFSLDIYMYRKLPNLRVITFHPFCTSCSPYSNPHAQSSHKLWGCCFVTTHLKYSIYFRQNDLTAWLLYTAGSISYILLYLSWNNWCIKSSDRTIDRRKCLPLAFKNCANVPIIVCNSQWLGSCGLAVKKLLPAWKTRLPNGLLKNTRNEKY